MDLRHSANEFHFASSIPVAKEKLISFGSSNNNIKKIYVTDLKMTGGGTTTNVKFFVASAAASCKSLFFKVASVSSHNMTWNLPFRMIFSGSTTETRRFVASAGNVGVKYAISGYLER